MYTVYNNCHVDAIVSGFIIGRQFQHQLFDYTLKTPWHIAPSVSECTTSSHKSQLRQWCEFFIPSHICKCLLLISQYSNLVNIVNTKTIKTVQLCIWDRRNLDWALKRKQLMTAYWLAQSVHPARTPHLGF